MLFYKRCKKLCSKANPARMFRKLRRQLCRSFNTSTTCTGSPVDFSLTPSEVTTVPSIPFDPASESWLDTMTVSPQPTEVSVTSDGAAATATTIASPSSLKRRTWSNSSLDSFHTAISIRNLSPPLSLSQSQAGSDLILDLESGTQSPSFLPSTPSLSPTPTLTSTGSRTWGTVQPPVSRIKSTSPVDAASLPDTVAEEVAELYQQWGRLAATVNQITDRLTSGMLKDGGDHPPEHQLRSTLRHYEYEIVKIQVAIRQNLRQAGLLDDFPYYFD
ncbi:hypothetical protein H4R33_001860 [Dimargaris cristalligena]|uniref:Uncharacterized protein n=1 Tax=Dimargaris cristalligena TaxID=215637 RepID=A0A4Q0A2T6_9FUNG|nr:hypothetical protein H4R33_001860 [Dimargaris cristalligena]RKP40456.1 hypothetical protein BJ085DRAFT_37498 [Dimargaris cristalligena]|eukprot:RKP40456.1 hypothetical protein BJ085DRAFT_37498 [Dimargaris cristalligena]